MKLERTSVPTNTIEPSTEVTQPTWQRDSRYTDIFPGLPSGGAFYEFESLCVRRFTLPELTKLAAATTTASMRKLVEAVGATIDQPISSLTDKDFYYLLFWHRFHSFPSTPLVIDWMCDSDEHIFEVRSKKVDKKTLDNQYVADSSLLKEIKLNTESTLERIQYIKDRFDVLVRAPNVGDMVEVDEVGDLSEEDQWLNRFAGMLYPQLHGRTLKDRRAFLLQHSSTHPDDNILLLEDMQRFQTDFLNTYGVEEKATVTCKHCQHKAEVAVGLTPFNFFPLFR